MRRSFAAASVFLAATLAITLPSFPAQADDRATVPAVVSGGVAAAVEPDSLATLPQEPLTTAEAEQALEEAKRLTDGPGEEASKAEELAHSRSATLVLRDLWQARTKLTSGDRRVAARMLARPTDGDDLGGGITNYMDPALTRSDCTTSATFCVHYSVTDAAARNNAATVARTFDTVRNRLVGQLKYRAPLSDAGERDIGTAGNPNGKFDVFLTDIGKDGLYGYCAPTKGRAAGASPAYCVLDNDFKNFGGNDLNEMRVTAAHEYFHAIQFGYDPNEDIWMMEGSAVWAEEQVFGAINDYANYVRRSSAITHPEKPVDLDSIYAPDSLRVYSAGLFFIYASRRLGTDIVRQMWNRAVGPRHSLQAIRAAVESRTSWAPFLSRFAVWNTLPPGMGYPDQRLYPKEKYVAQRRLGLRGKKKFATIAFRRQHLASGSIKITPLKRKSATKQKLRLVINGPSKASGAVATLQRRLPNGRTKLVKVKLNKSGDATVTTRFNRRGKGKVSSIVLTLTNSSTRMKNCGSQSPVRYACSGHGVHNGKWKVSGRVVR